MVVENGRSPEKNHTQTPFRPPRNPHGVTETRTRDPSGGRRAYNRLRHEAPDKKLCRSNSLTNLIAFTNHATNLKIWCGCCIIKLDTVCIIPQRKLSAATITFPRIKKCHFQLTFKRAVREKFAWVFLFFLKYCGEISVFQESLLKKYNICINMSKFIKYGLTPYTGCSKTIRSN